MFSFFQKKRYLVDLLGGFTDFHNHILPGIDDGAKDVEESIELIEEFSKIGVENFVCTPHVMGEYYPNTPESIKKALDNLKSNTSVKLSASGEYMMDQQFSEIIEKGEILPIVETKVLVEMSYFQAPINLNEILFKLQNHSYSPILAHPERYVYFHSSSMEKYKDFKTRGCAFQLNMLSLIGHYGTNIQHKAFKLLEAGMIDFISSDAHRLEHIEKIKTISIKKKHLPILEGVIENSKNLFL
ncbi:histidinol phosphatase [Christiangramia fulva]|uniref:protein-tyrosine-phosphatase n=1 Tax=Christiangramia fulva TaxID=2126553 RepID=A0A2R3Z9C8_9FLAO|nr:CpsB/CapC family capsule biosynthesis tyrosine phosphatase [Christiangramia fulva]AVR46879.1 histidinol phosphatase [Christiangramia fulva]